jgi:hypothetical protein
VWCQLVPSFDTTYGDALHSVPLMKEVLASMMTIPCYNPLMPSCAATPFDEALSLQPGQMPTALQHMHAVCATAAGIYCTEMPPELSCGTVGFGAAAAEHSQQQAGPGHSPEQHPHPSP